MMGYISFNKNQILGVKKEPYKQKSKVVGG